MQKDRVLASSNDDEYSSSKKHSSDENETDQSPPSKSRKMSQGMFLQCISVHYSIVWQLLYRVNDVWYRLHCNAIQTMVLNCTIFLDEFHLLSKNFQND